MNSVSLSNSTDLNLAEKFISFATNGTGDFKGKPGFSEKIKETIHAACELNVGRQLLQEILDLGKSITIIEGEKYEGSINTIDDLKKYMISQDHFNPQQNSITINFEEKLFYIGLDKNGERQLFEHPILSIFVHECAHFKHCIQDEQAFQKRSSTPSSIDDMDDQEEELTISGSVFGSSEIEFCSENAVLSELQLPRRINHGSAYKRTYLESLVEMIFFRIIRSLEIELAIMKKEEVDPEFSDKILNSCLNIMEKCTVPAILKEYETIMELLISHGYKSDKILSKVLGKSEYLSIATKLINVGCKSDKALKVVLKQIESVEDISIRNEYFKICEKLLACGCKSDVALEIAIEQACREKGEHKLFKLMVVITLLLKAGCKSNKALEIVTEKASQETNPILVKEWYILAEILVNAGCSSLKTIENFVAVIKQTDHKLMKQHWMALVQPLLNEQFKNLIPFLREETFENFKKLERAEYSSDLMKFFISYLEDNSKEEDSLLVVLELLKDEFRMIHDYFDLKISIEGLKEDLDTISSNMSPYKKAAVYDNFLKATLYIAQLGSIILTPYKSTVRAEFTSIPQIEKLKEVFNNILGSYKKLGDKTELLTEDNFQILTKAYAAANCL